MRVESTMKGGNGKFFPCVIEVDVEKGCATIIDGFGTGYAWGWKPMKARPWLRMENDE